jgi:hypothetical protein
MEDRKFIESRLKDDSLSNVEIRNSMFHRRFKENSMIWCDHYFQIDRRDEYSLESFLDFISQEFTSGTGITFWFGRRQEQIGVSDLHYFKELQKLLSPPVPFYWNDYKNTLQSKIYTLKIDIMERKTSCFWQDKAHDYIEKFQLLLSLLNFMEVKVPGIYYHVILPQEKRKIFHETNGLVNLFVRRNSI